MKLEQQVCSLELAKRLKDLHVKQESLFWWMQAGAKDLKIWLPVLKSDAGDCAEFSAFTVAELGEMLPETLGSPHHPIKQYDVEQYKYGSETKNKYQIQLHDYIDGATHIMFVAFAETESDARGKMLIYLIENKLIPPSTP